MNKEELIRLTKSELVKIATELGISEVEGLSKSSIIDLILEGPKQYESLTEGTEQPESLIEDPVSKAMSLELAKRSAKVGTYIKTESNSETAFALEKNKRSARFGESKRTLDSPEEMLSAFNQELAKRSVRNK